MAAKYAWIITADLLEDGDATGTIGPAGAGPDHIAQLKNGQGCAFRMLDDDEVLSYRGRIIGDFDGLEPLDDFGMPNAGCTTIHLWKAGQGGGWEVV